jgi:serine/threonine protein kinase/Tfp pilus assembly protein PilF
MARNQSASVVSGQMIKQYRVVYRIGVGGNGEVYQAEDTRLQRKVALKFLPTHFTQDKRYLKRFEQEARAVAALSHPNVCMIHEVVETDDGRHCIVMEYIDGVTLRERVVERPMTISEAVEVAKQIASALSSAHAAGIIHRDIKLENIMLRRDGYVKVLDFGLAKYTDREPAVIDHDAPTQMLHTSPGMVVGTVYYMSPEQARGLSVDGRTDLWSLGVVLYEMVARKQPFTGATPTDVIISIAGHQPVPLSQVVPGVPSRLDAIVSKALVKDPDGRYQTADELLNDLKRLGRELDVHSGTERFSQPVAKPASPPTRAITSHMFPLKRARILLIAAMVVLIGVASWFALWSRKQRSIPLVQAGIRSLAVLPMANLSNDASQDYFADGMTETLIAGLAKIGALRVISRTSVMPYKGAQKPLPDIARELNVEVIVEGSVQRIGDQVQIHVNLINGPTDVRLWSNTYNRDLRDILTLQNEVVRDLTQQIQIKLTPQEQTNLSRARPINPKAYDYFLRGRYYASRQTKEDNETGIAMFDQAVAADPEFAAAWAELAQACIWRLFLFTPDEKKWEEKAYVAIQKALDIDPELPEAHLARGRLLWTPANHFPHDRAIQEYRRALAGNPNVDEAQSYLALVYIHIGAFDEALNELHKAMAINPSNGLTQFRISEAFLFQGKYEPALVGLRSTPRDVNPALVDHETAWALLNLGKKAEASEVIDKYLKEHPEDYGGLFAGLQAVVAASEGQQTRAEEKIKLAVERGKGFGHFHHTAYYIACAYARMNKVEEAVKWLQNAADDGFPCYPMFASDANLDNLRQDARFISFLEKQRQQWESYKTLL